MTIRHLYLPLLFFFLINSNPILAQFKMGLEIAPTIRFLNKENTDFANKNYFAIAGGLRFEKRLGKRFWWEFGGDVTYYSGSKDVPPEFGDCLNCLRVAGPVTPNSIGYKTTFFELELPNLIKFRIVEANQSLLTLFAGYGPGYKIYTQNVIYVPEGENHEEYPLKDDPKIFHAFHIGLEYQYAINDKWSIGVASSFRHRVFTDEVNYNGELYKENQYRLHLKVLRNLSKTNVEEIVPSVGMGI